MNKKDLFIILILLQCLCLSAWARKPAVEPVQGISIDEYKPVPPSQAQGYDFNSGKATTINKHESKPTSNFPWSILFLLALLPAGISLVIVKKSRKIPALPDNAINLDEHRKKKEDKEWRKAS